MTWEESDREIFTVIAQHPGVSGDDIMRRVNASLVVILRGLDRLARQGMIRIEGELAPHHRPCYITEEGHKVAALLRG